MSAKRTVLWRLSAANGCWCIRAAAAAAAADSLKDQATRLARAVEVFRLGGAARHTAG